MAISYSIILQNTAHPQAMHAKKLLWKLLRQWSLLCTCILVHGFSHVQGHDDAHAL